MPRLPWRALLLWALLGTVVAVTSVLVGLGSSQDVLGTLVDTSPADPSAALLQQELGPDAVRPGGKHDGAYYYAIARDLFSPATAATSLDGPRYRLQRVGFPLLVWVVHPTGGGPGLLWTMFAVGVAGSFGGALAMGALSVTWRGPPWVAVLFPVLPGTMISLRITVADPLALALALAALVVWVRHRPSSASARRPVARDRWCLVALALAVLATLTKETTWLVFVGYWAAVRTRDALALVVAPGVVAGAWALLLTRMVPAGSTVPGFALPFTALPDVVSLWGSAGESMGYLSILLGVLLGAEALRRRGLGHPLSYVVLIQLAFLVVVSPSVLVPERSATRQVMPLVVAAALMLATPDAARLRAPAPTLAPG